MLKKSLILLAQKSSLFGKLKRWYQECRDWYYRSLPIDEKLIVFEAFRSTKYADSPRAIYEYLLESEDYKTYRFIWVFEHPENYKFLENDRTKLVKHETNGYYTVFARAKYWVVNGWIPLRIQKKDNQVALQCWHGTPLKRLRYDINSSIKTDHRSNALRDNDLDMLRYDYFLSPSKFATKVFTSAFNLKTINKEGIIIQTGYPRNDRLLTFKDGDIVSIKERLGIPKDKKVMLYAPTWRDDQQAKKGGYTYKSPIDFKYLRDQLSDEWVILFRAHGLANNGIDLSDYTGFVFDVAAESDINDLYIISDVLMTDYSSVFFDYANLKRPIIFYMYDRKHYESTLRGFYLQLEELPGDVISQEKDIVRIVRDITKYDKKHANTYQKFSRKFNNLDDGAATSRAVEIVFRHNEVVNTQG